MMRNVIAPLLIWVFVQWACLSLAQSIVVDSLSPNQSFYCTGDTVWIHFTALNFTGTNTFSARMSKSDFVLDSTTMNSIALAGSPITGVIAYVFQTANADVDSGYRLRIRSGGVVSTLFPATAFVVNPKPVAVASITTQTICSGTAFTTIALSTGNSVAGTTYAWSRNNLNVGGISAGVGDITGSALTNNTLTNQTVTYSITPTGPAPSSCAGNAITATVVVRPVPVVTSANSDTICSGSRVNITLTSTVTSTYQWYADDNSNTNGENLFTQTTAILRDTIINLTAQDEIVYYNVIPTSTAGGCVGNPQIVTVTVNPKPVLLNDSAESICSGTTVSIPLSSNIPSNFSWRATSNTFVTGESTTLQTTDTLRNTLTNSTISGQTVIYTVTPVSVGGSCAGTADTIAVTVFPKPIANFSIGASPSQCERGNRFTFTATSNAAIINYLWTFGSALAPSADTGATVVESFTGTGDSIIVKLLTETANNCPDSIQKIINVYPMPTGVFTVSDSTPCSGDTVWSKQIDASNTNSLIWTWGDGTANTTCTGCDSGIHHYSSSVFPSVRTVRLIAISARNCRDTSFATVDVKPNPFATFIADDNLKCFNNGNHQFVFTSTSVIADSVNNPVNYYWNFEDNSTEVLTRDAVHTYAVADSYRVTHVVTSAYGCSDSAFFPVVVYLNPQVQITNNTGIDTLCGEQAVTLSAESGFTYLWSTGATTRTIATIDSTAQSPYTIVYTVTVTDDDNCTGASSKAITVIPTLYQPEITYDTTLVFCMGAKAQVFTVANTGSSVFEWNTIPAWVNDVTGEQLNMDLPNTPYDTFTLYIVAVDSLWGCLKSDSVSFSISAGSAPTAGIVRDLYTLICTNNTVSSYQWGYDDANFTGHTLTGETLQSYNAVSDPDFAVSGKYYWVKITDAGGCQSKIYYQSPPQYYTTVEVLNSGSMVVRVYPNPAGDRFAIETQGDVKLKTVEVRNAATQLIYFSACKQEMTVNTTEWSSGVYFVKVISENGATQTLRLIKL